MKSSRYPVTGAGLGLRRALLGPLQDLPLENVSFMEVAPENWIDVGGARGRMFRHYVDHFPFLCHGLSLSIGGPSPLDEAYLQRVKHFLDEHNVLIYSEHLSYCTDDGHLYDLMPIPFTEEAVSYVAARIRRTQAIVERQIAIENVSYYAAPGQELEEIEFVRAILEEADCKLLLDVNNIYVNSVNHRYDAVEYLSRIPTERIAYGHIAGHYNEAEDLIVDTHAAPVIDNVWALLDRAYAIHGVFPTLLERDFNIPPVEELLAEVDRIKEIQNRHARSDQQEADERQAVTRQHA